MAKTLSQAERKRLTELRLAEEKVEREKLAIENAARRREEVPIPAIHDLICISGSLTHLLNANNDYT